MAEPFRQFILKVHSRCDLACDYCYVYTKADQRWSDRPRIMSRRTIEATATRIAEHAHAHALPAVDIVLHGGEPLLAGRSVLEECVRTVRSAAEGVDVRFSIQTNGLRLDQDFLDLFGALGVRVGVSIDGDRAATDRHRRRPNGAGSYDQVSAALRRLGEPRNRAVFAGLLCTVDLRNDPVATYEALLAHDPPRIDLLLPHGNWDHPPPFLDGTGTPYADWLIAVFDRWYAAPHRETGVRRFEELMHVLLGGGSGVEGVGLGPTVHIVVETDGAIEASDMLTDAHEGAAVLGLDVARHSFDEALAHPAIAAQQRGLDSLGPECRECPVLHACGGGLLPHRYRAGSFAHPSVYCRDLYALIGHVRARLVSDLAPLRR